MEGNDLNGVFKIRNINDGEKVQDWAKNCKNVVVTGAGLIGIEIAHSLKKICLNVTLNEMLPQIVLRSLDAMSDILTEYLEKEELMLF